MSPVDRVSGPSLGLIEGKDVERIAILLKHARDDFEVSFVLTRFEVGTAQLPKIIEHDRRLGRNLRSNGNEETPGRGRPAGVCSSVSLADLEEPIELKSYAAPSVGTSVSNRSNNGVEWRRATIGQAGFSKPHPFPASDDCLPRGAM
jgi:hypothetical protein